MAEVAVDQATGQIRVKRVTVAQDLDRWSTPRDPLQMKAASSWAVVGP